MAEKKLHFLVLASLLHDIGKLFERGGLFQEAQEDHTYLDRCPTKHNIHTHVHSAYTAAFCDWLEEKFDCLRTSSYREWKDWCSVHHRNDESGFEATVIRVSDRLSARERDEGQYYRKGIHLKTLLEPITERLFINKNKKLAAFHRFPLTRLSSNKESFFPGSAEELGLEVMDNPEDGVADPAEWSHLLTREPLVKEYRKLGEGLLADLEELSRCCPSIAIEDLVATVPMLLERYTAMVPSATNVRHPDISLFDHLRCTAAIAQALYLFQINRGNPLEGISVEDEAKWVLVCGDFSGIQKFIYNLTNKGAAKGLRGRSFYVQYMCKVCADFFLRRLDLTPAALLYNSGGKFYLLLPAHLAEGGLNVRQEINKWLLEEFGGEVYLGLGLAEVTAAMFSQGEMSSAWKTAALDLERDRTQKFREALAPEFFAPATDFDPTKSCAVCGSRSQMRDGDRCETCRRLEEIGAKLKDTEAILTVWNDSNRIRNIIDGPSFPLLGACCLLIKGLSDRKEQFNSLDRIEGELTLLNEFAEMSFSDPNLPIPNCAVSGMYLGKWESDRQMKQDGIPWDFEDYALNSEGIKRLGVLRMDVDNLGLVFIQGLRFARRKSLGTATDPKKGWGEVVVNPESGEVERRPMASISRMVTLSRQLNHFFSGYVPTLLKEERFDRCQVIYAGGDDLFVIGSWHQLPLLAKTIRDQFRTFCCGNPDLSISGGLILQRGRYPIYKGAQLAGLAEEMGKYARRNWKLGSSETEKNGFCFLGVPVLWEDFDLAEVVTKMLEPEIRRGKRGLLSFLLHTVRANKLHVQSLCFVRGLSIPEAWIEIEYGPWRWRTAYQLRRRYDDAKERERWASVLLGDTINSKKAKVPVYTWLELPLRWTEFIHRT